ncbi:Uncharacterised protein [[Clostridium] sordellii]|uniref:hypothetical protein n=1 Tax=Paraclostridium sordellii TaxID=1505 RepID=UPI0005EA63A6|nr:hypothetical protein [Paeniclostridium sordellii]MDU1453162.1 hypothetical protein [Paeniclostridium sordellii]CEQ21603.1 Uncharacterised protein [[Clostridium] sordellii] [Paeniclostridium sordellii]
MIGKNNLTKMVLKETKELLMDYSEIGVDQFLNDDFLKEIPILKSFASAINLGKTINNAYFYKKLALFIQNIQGITTEDREKFLNKYCKDDELFGERLIICIDRLDEIPKSVYLANIFKKLCNDDIDQETFFRFISIIDKIYSVDLDFLKTRIEEGKKYIGGVNAIALTNLGLAMIGMIDASKNIFKDDIYVITPLGLDFYKCIFN